jgi:hypothetical protein
MRFFLLIPVLLLFTSLVKASAIEGQVIEMPGFVAVPGVNIRNIATGEGRSTDKEGKFTIAALAGQLVEFSKEGYKTYRFRLPAGKLPPYFRIGLERAPIITPAAKTVMTYRDDSLRYYALYRKELSFPRFSALDVIQHPFSAMSKYNRQVWNFQENYAMLEREKYISYTFNKALVADLTGLQGDSLINYMDLFRPGYEQLRSMNEYTYYSYIKQTVSAYRQRGPRARMSIQRNTP